MRASMSEADFASLVEPRRGAIEAAARRGVYAVAPLTIGGLLQDPEMESRNASALDGEEAPWIAAFIDGGGLDLAEGPVIVDASRAARAMRLSVGGPGGREGALARATALARVSFMGTDGMRGAVERAAGRDCVADFFGVGRLQPALVRIAAKAYGRMMVEEGLAREGDRVAIAEDGRDAAWDGILKAALIEGLGEAELSILDLGVVPTPFVPWAMLRRGLACGAMLTASHNPANQNGVKFFREGRKLLPEGRAGDFALSGRMYREYLALRTGGGGAFYARVDSHVGFVPRSSPRNVRKGIGAKGTNPTYNPFLAEPTYLAARCEVVESARIEDEAAAFVVSALPEGASRRLLGLRVAADASSGAGHALLARIFGELGIDGTIVSPEPNGANINRGCGAAEIEGRARYLPGEAVEAPSVIQELFARGRASKRLEWGMALDGDGDRGFVLAYDPERDEVGVVNGDQAGAIFARRAAATGAATGDFVASVESDPLCARYVREELGIRAEVVSVGDKWLGAYSKGPLLVGVEPSGHVVMPLSVSGPDGVPRELRAGNGILTCLATIDAALELGLGLAEAIEPYTKGFCRTFYTHVVAKSRFFPGSAAWEASAEAIRSAFRSQIGRGAIPEGTELAFEDKEDPFTLYASFGRKGSREAAAFCRNSGTEDKIAAYVQCPTPWSSAFLEIGRALAEAHGQLMRDVGRPEYRAGEAIVAALRDCGSRGIAVEAVAEAIGDAGTPCSPADLRGVLAGLVKEGRARIRDGRIYEGEESSVP
jgi:phosphoglucosamine mutase